MGNQRIEYEWFVEPLDAHTNGVFAETIGDDTNYSEETNQWRCSWKLVYAFQRARQSKNLRFRIFSRANNGKIRECTFLYKRIRQLADGGQIISPDSTAIEDPR